MAKTKLGVDATKAAYGFIISLSMKSKKHLSDDGKIDFTEGLDLVLHLREALPVYPQLKHVPAELKDFDPEDKAEIEKMIREEIECDDKEMEWYLERVANCVANLASLIVGFPSP